MPLKATTVVSATTAEKPKRRYPGEAKGFVEEMRFVAMKLHTREQAKEGEKEVQKPEERAVPKWEPSVEGYLRFLVDSKLVYDTLESIVEKAAFHFYTEFKNTGLERSESLAKDLEWFKEQGYAIPEPSTPGTSYAQYLKELSEKDPQAFICHFYNIYFAHSAGGRMIGKKVAEKILNSKELEFYKWDGDLSRLLQNVRDKLNKVAESWTREERNHCLVFFHFFNSVVPYTLYLSNSIFKSSLNYSTKMASFNPIPQSESLLNKPHLQVSPSPYFSLSRVIFQSSFALKGVSFQLRVPVRIVNMPLKATTVVSATTAQKPKKRYPGEAKGFVEEMRFVAMKLHTREQAKEGEKDVQKPEERAVPKWEPSVEGYLRFLVDSKLVYDTLESIVDKAAFPFYAEFKNTGLERSESLATDLECFKEQGYAIPEPSTPGTSYAQYLKELSEKDPQAFICHFYNIYFAHTAGGRMIGKKVAEKILNSKELEFYKWDGDLSQLLQNVREKLNKVAESWTREENHCLEETEKSFKYSGEILRLILS